MRMVFVKVVMLRYWHPSKDITGLLTSCLWPQFCIYHIYFLGLYNLNMQLAYFIKIGR